MAALPEVLVAYGAVERPLAAVDEVVARQMTLTQETLATRFAGILRHINLGSSSDGTGIVATDNTTGLHLQTLIGVHR